MNFGILLTESFRQDSKLDNWQQEHRPGNQLHPVQVSKCVILKFLIIIFHWLLLIYVSYLQTLH